MQKQQIFTAIFEILNLQKKLRSKKICEYLQVLSENIVLSRIFSNIPAQKHCVPSL